MRWGHQPRHGSASVECGKLTELEGHSCHWAYTVDQHLTRWDENHDRMDSGKLDWPATARPYRMWSRSSFHAPTWTSHWQFKSTRTTDPFPGNHLRCVTSHDGNINCLVDAILMTSRPWPSHRTTTLWCRDKKITPPNLLDISPSHYL